MPAPPCMDAAVPDDTAYDQLQLLCLRESGAATELLKGTRALNLRTPELSALVQDMLEAQRVFVCALGRWTEHTAGPAARRLAGKLAGVSEALDAAARRAQALHSPLRKQIDYSASPEIVSSDFVGSRHACIFDAKATIVNGNQAVLYLWYDNEYGYSCQVYRVLERMAGIRYQTYPVNSPYPL